MTIVLQRDKNGREVLWKCSSCGQPFDLGWGSECNKCLTEERRHRELVAATKKEVHAPTGGASMTEQHRQNLLTACAFAQQFLKAADMNVGSQGASPAIAKWCEECQRELAAALRNLKVDAPVPTVDWREVVRELDAE
jgi:hypothetical protein